MTKDLIIKITSALQTVQDPDFKKDLISLDMIRDIYINGNKISFTLVLTTFACPLQEIIKKKCIEAIYTTLGKNWEISINIDAKVISSLQKTIDLPTVKNIIAIASGKGGVGKSTITTNLAVSLSLQGAKVGVLDADIFGPSLPMMFGCNNTKPLTEKVGDKNYLSPVVCHNVKLMSMGLLTPTEDTAMVWRGPMASKAVKQILYDTLWGDIDYLIVDLPPGTSDIHITLATSVPLMGVVIVTTPQCISIIDAEKAVTMFTKQIVNIPILGIIENMSYLQVKTSASRYQKLFPFGRDGGSFMAKKFNIFFLGKIPIDKNICTSCDKGIPIVLDKTFQFSKELKSISQALAQQISIVNAKIK